jgi:hypothetical protein
MFKVNIENNSNFLDYFLCYFLGYPYQILSTSYAQAQKSYAQIPLTYAQDRCILGTCLWKTWWINCGYVENLWKSC